MISFQLTDDQLASKSGFREFANDKIAPIAGQCDREEQIPACLIKSMAAAGYFGLSIEKEYGGTGADAITNGLLHYEIGRASVAAQGLVNVSTMASLPVARLGNREQKRRWLPSIVQGERIAAIAITEPAVGTDIKAVETTATRRDDTYLLSGTKQWITFGQIADVFLVLASVDGQPSAFIVERETPGFTVTPIKGTLGCRAYMLAQLVFEDCEVPGDAILGKPGTGMAWAANTGLDIGRYNLSWACVGLGQACLDSCLDYTQERSQFGVLIKQHQLVQQMITDMATEVQAARLLSCHAGYLRDRRDSNAVTATMMAKYYASQMVNRVAPNAVQLHGANGCSASYPVERYMRDAKIMEIIEGTTQIHQVLIADAAYRMQGWMS